MTDSSARNHRRVCITGGDPAGVGPELVATALPHILAQGIQPLVIMPPLLLEQAQKLTGNHTPFVLAQPEEQVAADQVHVWFPDNTPLHFNPGEISREAGQVANLSLETAVELVSADPKMPLVTAPVNKKSLHLAGFQFPGQTEFLGARDGDRPRWMIMYHEKISVVLATIHLPLMEVSSNLNPDLLLNCITALHSFLQRLGREETITVLALNPHASEDGLFGKEEEKIIIPAVERAAALGIPVRGPVSADTAFTQGSCFIAMYHDQAMIPFKLTAGWEGVNVTWGLSFIRTSPDHGTAFPLAWQGRVDPASMLAAVDLAIRLST
jgi:4-hydroxythreonine-4-phosphate dehydrogenase